MINRLPTGHSSLAQQLYRAAISIPLNIVEGAGEFSRKDKARFYRIALRSTTECAAILDVCRKLELVDEEALQAGRQLLLRIVAMLTAIARKLSGSGTGSGSETIVKMA
jgi:four helix bundle protein